MSFTRQLVGETEGARVFHVFDEGGNRVGVDEERILSPAEETRQALRSRAEAALAANAAYLDLGTPTAAQLAAQVKALTRQNNALIRLVLERLDTDEGT